jgi:hypothetical protein
VIRIFGLRRSGNHAVINWLTRNAPGRSIFFNNCKAGENPFKAHNGIEIDGQHVRRAGAKAKRLARKVGHGATVFFSYENVMPHEDRKKPINPGVEDDDITHDVIIARDFLNWAASLVKKLQGNDRYKPHQRLASILRVVDVYAQMLDLVLSPKERRAVVRYGDWHNSATYRATVLDQIGFVPRDDSTSEVQAYGSGSSFQPDATDAAQLRPLDRWQQMKDDPEYRTLLWLVSRDDTLVEKLHRVFPDNTDALRDMTKGAPYMSLDGLAQTSSHDTARPQIPRRN